MQEVGAKDVSSQNLAMLFHGVQQPVTHYTLHLKCVSFFESNNSQHLLSTLLTVLLLSFLLPKILLNSGIVLILEAETMGVDLLWIIGSTGDGI